MDGILCFIRDNFYDITVSLVTEISSYCTTFTVTWSVRILMYRSEVHILVGLGHSVSQTPQ